MATIKTKFVGASQITYAKIQNESASTLLGNPTGSPAAPSEVTLGTGLSFVGSVLTAAASVAATSTTPGTITREATWTSYTPTITGMGTVTNNSAFYKILGDSLMVRGFFTSGTVSGTLFSVSMPGSFSISSAKLPQNNTTSNPGNMCGYMGGGAANNSTWLITATGTSTTLIYAGAGFTTGLSILPANGSAFATSSANYTYQFEVPLT